MAGVSDISAPSMPKSPGAFLQSGRRPGKEITTSMRNYVGTTYCAPNVKLTPAE